MEDLLGSWSTFGSEHAFQNGLPNSISIAIWHATLSNFAKSIGASCRQPQLEFHPTFAADPAEALHLAGSRTPEATRC